MNKNSALFAIIAFIVLCAGGGGTFFYLNRDINAEIMLFQGADDNITLAPGKQYLLSPTISPKDCNEEFMWISSNDSIATISDEGLITAIAPGSADITLLATRSKKKASTHITVESDQPVQVQEPVPAPAATRAQTTTYPTPVQTAPKSAGKASSSDIGTYTVTKNYSKVGKVKDVTLDLGYAYYIGTIEDGVPSGMGKLVFKRSHNIIPGKQYTASRGETFEGVFTKGEPTTGSWHMTDGKSKMISK